MSKGRILLVDDELVAGQTEPGDTYMWYYVQALKDSEYEVKEVIGPDEALADLKSGSAGYDLVIIDIMLPPGEAYKEADTRNGMDTGILLARKVHVEYPELPILILTNVKTPRGTQRLADAGVPPKQVLAKQDNTPFQVVNVVSGLLGE